MKEIFNKALKLFTRNATTTIIVLLILNVIFLICPDMLGADGQVIRGLIPGFLQDYLAGVFIEYHVVFQAFNIFLLIQGVLLTYSLIGTFVTIPKSFPLLFSARSILRN